MTKEEMARAYADGYNKEYQQIAYDAFLCGYGAKCESFVSEDLEEAAEKASKTWRKNEDGSESKELFPQAFVRGFIAGAEWYRQQMLNGAKDGYVSAIIIHNNGDEEHYAVTYPIGERPHSITDKVKIIIL